MRLEYWWQDWHLEELLESYLPDFVLAFAFFASVVYAVLGKRFEQQRPAIAMSAAIGLALSFGLVWWEQANNFSIKNLGPFAVGFAILFLAFVMYQCIRQVSGSWAGAGITIGASILIAGLLGFKVPIDAKIIQTVTVVALIIGLMALFAHRRPLHPHSRPTKQVLPDIKHSMADLYRERHMSKKLDHGLRTLRKKATTLHERPEEAADIARYISARKYILQSTMSPMSSTPAPASFRISNLFLPGILALTILSMNTRSWSFSLSFATLYLSLSKPGL